MEKLEILAENMRMFVACDFKEAISTEERLSCYTKTLRRFQH